VDRPSEKTNDPPSILACPALRSHDPRELATLSRPSMWRRRFCILLQAKGLYIDQRVLIHVVSTHVVLPEVGLAEPPAAPDSAFPPALPKSMSALEMAFEGASVDMAGLADTTTMLRFGLWCGGRGGLCSFDSRKLLSLVPRMIVTQDRAMRDFPSRGWVQTMALPVACRIIPGSFETIKAVFNSKQKGVCRGQIILDQQVRGVTVVRVVVIQGRLKGASRWR